MDPVMVPELNRVQPDIITFRISNPEIYSPDMPGYRSIATILKFLRMNHPFSCCSVSCA
jgi:hypothetical protein